MKILAKMAGADENKLDTKADTEAAVEATMKGLETKICDDGTAVKSLEKQISRELTETVENSRQPAMNSGTACKMQLKKNCKRIKKRQKTSRKSKISLYTSDQDGDTR